MIRTLCLAIWLASCSGTPALAAPKPRKAISCKPAKPGVPVWMIVGRMKDGDTWEGVCADRFGFPEVYREGGQDADGNDEGIDTPEKSKSVARCPEEIAHAKKASAFAEELRAAAKGVALVTVFKRKEKYGRYLSLTSFWIDGGLVRLGDALITAGYALPYAGGKKADWCALLAPKVPVNLLPAGFER
jgi:endonuclease YncB( thermonuclease family)